MKRFCWILLLLAAAALCCACGARENENGAQGNQPPQNTAAAAEPKPAPEPEPEPEPTAAERLLAGMTLREKVGQLFVIRPEALGGSATALSDAACAALSERPAGGFCLFRANIEAPAQLRAFIAELSAALEIPALLAVDEEGGRVTRLAGRAGFELPKVGSMESIAATGDAANAFAAGDTIGAYLAEYGFTLDLAPDADVNTNPDNVVIGDRAFGSDPAVAAEMVGAYLDGLHAHAVGGCLKHFPGHGDTAADTHAGFVAVTKTWEELLGAELIPFAENLAAADAVMVAHLTLPNVTSDGRPATLSHELVSEKLRGELGYDGLIITDALEMGAITEGYGSAEAAVLAFEAGCDLLLMPADYPAAFDAVLAAAERGDIPMQRIDESVLRILTFKLNNAEER